MGRRFIYLASKPPPCSSVLRQHHGECPSGAAAIRRAQALASGKANAGALAFSRSGDPNLGEFEDAVILKAFGEVPEDFAAREYELLGIALTRKQSCQRELQGARTD